MWTLKGTFIELCKNEVMKNDLDAYPFIIHFSKNYGLKLFTLKSEQRDKWVTTMKGVLKYSSFSDFYKLRVKNVIFNRSVEKHWERCVWESDISNS